MQMGGRSVKQVTTLQKLTGPETHFIHEKYNILLNILLNVI